MKLYKIQRKLMLLHNFLIQRKHKVLSTELQQPNLQEPIPMALRQIILAKSEQELRKCHTHH